VRALIEAAVPRVECAEHGVVVAQVPWARHGSDFTSTFENTIAWLAVRTDNTTLSGLMRIAWRTVGAIVERVYTEARKSSPPLAGVRKDRDRRGVELTRFGGRLETRRSARGVFHGEAKATGVYR
jgi:transposase